MMDCVVSWSRALGTSYCEVPIQEISLDEIPIVSENPAIMLGAETVNIVDEYFTYMQFNPDMFVRRISYRDETSKLCCCYIKYAQRFKSWVHAEFPCIDGCGGQLCVEASKRLYAMLVVHDSDTYYRTVHVFCVDSLPAIVIARDDGRCAITWMADIINVVIRDMLYFNAQRCVEEYMQQHIAMQILLRVCNGRFLKRLSLEDFKREVVKRKQGGYSQ